jgi:hypothetical protein
LEIVGGIRRQVDGGDRGESVGADVLQQDGEVHGERVPHDGPHYRPSNDSRPLGQYPRRSIHEGEGPLHTLEGRKRRAGVRVHSAERRRTAPGVARGEISPAAYKPFLAARLSAGQFFGPDSYCRATARQVRTVDRDTCNRRAAPLTDRLGIIGRVSV